MIRKVIANNCYLTSVHAAHRLQAILDHGGEFIIEGLTLDDTGPVLVFRPPTEEEAIKLAEAKKNNAKLLYIVKP